MSSSSNSSDTKEEHAGDDAKSSPDQAEAGGHSGEGAASAMKHMISRGEEKQRQQTGGAGDAPGSNHP